VYLRGSSRSRIHASPSAAPFIPASPSFVPIRAYSWIVPRPRSYSHAYEGEEQERPRD